MDKTTSSVFWLLNDFHLKLKNIIWLFLKAYFDCFAKGHIHNVVSTLPNVVKPDVENNNVVSMLFDVDHIDFKIHNVDSTLFNVVNFDVKVQSVVSTLIWCCSTSRRRINLKATLKRRWNVCWGGGGSGSGSDSTSACGSNSIKILSWTGKYKLGAIAGVRIGKCNLGTRTGKCKVFVRIGKCKLDRFHPGVKDAWKKKYISPEAKSHPGENFTRVEIMRVNYPLLHASEYSRTVILV